MIAYAIIVQAVKTPSSPSRRPAPPDFYDGRDYDAGDSVGHLMHQVVASMRREIEQRMGRHGLTAAQWLPLWKLRLGVARTAQELARQMDVDAGSITRLLDRMEAKGLILRERSATDRRVVHLVLTPAGEAVVEQVPQVLADVNNRRLRGFSLEEWGLLKSLLRRMVENGATSDGAAEGADGAAAEASDAAGPETRLAHAAAPRP